MGASQRPCGKARSAVAAVETHTSKPSRVPVKHPRLGRTSTERQPDERLASRLFTLPATSFQHLRQA